MALSLYEANIKSKRKYPRGDLIAVWAEASDLPAPQDAFCFSLMAEKEAVLPLVRKPLQTYLGWTLGCWHESNLHSLAVGSGVLAGLLGAPSAVQTSWGSVCFQAPPPHPLVFLLLRLVGTERLPSSAARRSLWVYGHASQTWRRFRLYLLIPPYVCLGTHLLSSFKSQGWSLISP